MDLRRDLFLYHRQLRLSHFNFENNISTVPCTGPSCWCPPKGSNLENLKVMIDQDIRTLIKLNLRLGSKNNLSPKQQKTLKELNLEDIIIKPADKRLPNSHPGQTKQSIQINSRHYKNLD